MSGVSIKTILYASSSKECVNNDGLWNAVYEKTEFSFIDLFFHHADLQETFEMYYNKNKSTTKLQTVDLYVSLENAFLKSC